jgi:GNAT superfamily N-acetyltransferase
MAEFKIRPATSLDTDQIAEFQMAMAFETESIRLDSQRCRAGVQAVFEQPTRGTYYVAEHEGDIVASLLVIVEWSDWRCGEVWWIHSVYVRPEFRRQRVFSQMFEFLKARGLEDSGFRGLRLFVEKKNERAKTTYRSLGMSSEHYDLFEWMTSY